MNITTPTTALTIGLTTNLIKKYKTTMAITISTSVVTSIFKKLFILCNFTTKQKNNAIKKAIRCYLVAYVFVLRISSIFAIIVSATSAGNLFPFLRSCKSLQPSLNISQDLILSLRSSALT